MTPPKNVFWDSCVFIRFLTRQPQELLGHIDQYVQEARCGKLTIDRIPFGFVSQKTGGA